LTVYEIAYIFYLDTKINYEIKGDTK
jgi:hypothetical protein